MQGKRFFIGFMVILAIFTMTLFVANTWAATQEKVLHSFNNNGTDGNSPWVGLVMDAAGNLYGTTANGGTYGYGTVFELTRSPHAGAGGWTERVLHNFNNTDGADPQGSLIMDAAGNLDGTTMGGGIYGYGTVFELTRSPRAGGGGWMEKVLHNFDYQGTDGASPVAALVADAAGNLYGSTMGDGTYTFGTVFELIPGTGSWTEKVLHTFDYTDGDQPFATLIIDGGGNLYGTTINGGTYGWGTVFELIPIPGGGWTEQVLHSFNVADGAKPYAGLIFDALGNLYGTTKLGGPNGYGTVFELTPAGDGWTEQVLHSFVDNGTDGTNPLAGLIFDASGSLYGTTFEGGAYNQGTAFKLTLSVGGGWTEEVMHSFTNTGGDGCLPEYGSLIFDVAGNLYGTTANGGTYGYGTVFEIRQ